MVYRARKCQSPGSEIPRNGIRCRIRRVFFVRRPVHERTVETIGTHALRDHARYVHGLPGPRTRTVVGRCGERTGRSFLRPFPLRTETGRKRYTRTYELAEGRRHDLLPRTIRQLEYRTAASDARLRGLVRFLYTVLLQRGQFFRSRHLRTDAPLSAPGMENG